ncbi:hypothetical protein E3N88_20112 [Mikania micrantha]|uniref:Uncharacterized protein n=1 Tax=Mikania micrantha TaxID=192012 RepID=A0A5N6NHA0_9ASTR|nr:hypothetical protein E3N88_20112 [Mikania micrantha]
MATTSSHQISTTTAFLDYEACNLGTSKGTSVLEIMVVFEKASSHLIGFAIGHNLTTRWRQDDNDGHYVFVVGDNLTTRYKINGKMGEERKEMVAIKIVRAIKKYREAAMIKIDVLQQLGKHDKGGNRCVQIRNWFDYRNHICIMKDEKVGYSNTVNYTGKNLALVCDQEDQGGPCCKDRDDRDDSVDREDSSVEGLRILVNDFNLDADRKPIETMKKKEVRNSKKMVSGKRQKQFDLH